MKKKLRIIYNLLFKGVNYIENKEVKHYPIISLIDGSKVITIRGQFDVPYREARASNRPIESYILQVKEQVSSCPEFLDLIEVEYRDGYSSNGDKIIKFEAEFKIVI